MKTLSLILSFLIYTWSKGVSKYTGEGWKEKKINKEASGLYAELLHPADDVHASGLRADEVQTTYG